MRVTLNLVILILISMPVFAQNKPGMLKDVFKGIIPDAGVSVTTVLTLNHMPYADDGDFTMKETFIDAQKKERTATCFGEWTVIKGDAKDENATVVEIDAPGRIMYFLRLKNGNLLKLDTSLKEIMPTTKYILHKDNGLVSGTYVGSRPLTGSTVETTLKLDCAAPCHEGNYVLHNKYVGTPKGAAKSSLADSAKGKWQIAKTTIVLDPDKTGKSTYYQVKEDGNLLPLDNNMKPATGPLDGTLEKK